VTSLEYGLWSIPVLLFLIFLRLPIGLVMFVIGVAGTSLVTGSTVPALAQLKSLVYSTFSNYSLSIVPLFLLMGQFATRGGMSRALFKAAETWSATGAAGSPWRRSAACAGFGAICGSSLATAATMGQVALPEMRRYGYSGALSTACLAAGGTLGILIPPSVVLVIYAILTEQNIAKLFMAAFVPGILAAAGYMITVSLYVRLRPDSAGHRDRAALFGAHRALVGVWPVLLIFVAVIGGIYSGVFTPTEGAAVGAAGTGLIALVEGRPRPEGAGGLVPVDRDIDRHDLLHRARRGGLQRVPRLLARCRSNLPPMSRIRASTPGWCWC
jgi:C4-dicarboxylate transporter DctM subunit